MSAGLDMTESIVPKSDQLNAEDLLTGPRTVTITEVRHGNGEQPFDFHLAEFPGRPFRPSKTVRRILVHAWGKDAATYSGRRMTLFRDPKVKWAGQEVGGIRVSHLSHIDKPFTLALAASDKGRATFAVQPLKDEPKPAATRAPADPDAITPDKVTELGAAMTNGLELADRDAKLKWLTEQLERPIKSPTELTRAEGDRLLELIRTWTEPPADESATEQQEIGQ